MAKPNGLLTYKKKWIFIRDEQRTTMVQNQGHWYVYQTVQNYIRRIAYNHIKTASSGNLSKHQNRKDTFIISHFVSAITKASSDTSTADTWAKGSKWLMRPPIQPLPVPTSSTETFCQNNRKQSIPPIPPSQDGVSTLKKKQQTATLQNQLS